MANDQIPDMSADAIRRKLEERYDVGKAELKSILQVLSHIFTLATEYHNIFINYRTHRVVFP